MNASRNLVLCSDGTGNTFERDVTNVTRLVSCLALDRPESQLVFYDQGVGTTERRQDAVERLRRDRTETPALRILAAPRVRRGRPATSLARTRGLLFGHGLEQNVRELYTVLARSYRETDQVYLFGFSRGAFTVRALAGLLHRCQLPPPDTPDLDESFDHAWRLYQPMVADRDAVAALRARHLPCPVHFLGLWDTVKSYGGLDPIILPHLRHNPDVRHVRHALALDERRAWFKATTWGQLDSDRDAAMTRLDPADTAAYERQDIGEVWFSGCHSDVGGGERETETARIALRWMVAEAATVQPGVLLNGAGRALLQKGDPPTPPVVHESWSLAWRAVEQVPRKEIDNSGVFPVKVGHRGSDGVRDPGETRRGGKVDVHASVRDPRWDQTFVRRVATKSLPPSSAHPESP